MPWQEVSTMSLRYEFVMLAMQVDTNIAALCRRFGVSRKTGYKWLARFARDGAAGLGDRSRRPHRSPNQSPALIEAAVIELRKRHPAWGGRKLTRRLVGDPGPSGRARSQHHDGHSSSPPAHRSHRVCQAHGLRAL